MYRKTRLPVLSLALPGLLALPAHAAPADPLSLQEARRGFALAAELCRADDGHLWGISLCGPMLFVDPATREFVANADGAQDPLVRRGDVFTGRLPDDVGMANTSVHWNGRDWAMVLWPLPTDRVAAAILLMHESWHRIQKSIGIPAIMVVEEHLATMRGRIALRLEMRALHAALTNTGDARRAAIDDALVFRAWRRASFPQAVKNENALELGEGLAEYTGRRLSRDPCMREHVAQRLQQADDEPSFARSFAYATGPAYGLLLDAQDPGWRSRVAARGDFGRMLADAVGFRSPADIAAAVDTRGARYGMAALRAQEEATEQARRKTAVAWRAQLVSGPTLALPAEGNQVVFDPRNLFPLPPFGTVYPTMSLAGPWGTLDVSHGALMDVDWKIVHVSARGVEHSGEHWKSAGWTLDLARGWIVEPGPRPGDLRVAPPPQAAQLRN